MATHAEDGLHVCMSRPTVLERVEQLLDFACKIYPSFRQELTGHPSSQNTIRAMSYCRPHCHMGSDATEAADNRYVERITPATTGQQRPKRASLVQLYSALTIRSMLCTDSQDESIPGFRM